VTPRNREYAPDPQEREKAVHCIALAALKGVGPARVRTICERWPTVREFHRAAKSAAPHTPQDVVGRAPEVLNHYEKNLARANDLVQDHLGRDVHVLGLPDTRYPHLLRLIPDPPPVLFVRGSVSALLNGMAIAVVGTRHPDARASALASRTAQHFAKHGWAIVSGLALGIDTEAHEGALSVGGVTVAVLAHGLDKVYPAQNRGLAADILANDGALVSELPFGVAPTPSAFVRRDRIQSGLAAGVVIAQTGAKGGTMHTARFAERQDRQVLCPAWPPGLLQRDDFSGVRALIERGRCTVFDGKNMASIMESLARWSEDHQVSADEADSGRLF
jgi:DNA processing protein